ncbi:hypothetical protein [Calothrix sp. PCC 7507]|uniref:hypothetical protein n=1 Tax=Calothrix sp. PCC 7507 TaxID=99598 RepID=UPI00029F20B1|nr:hypothetical protein [Calothrix sp. PCC 7507]AFY31807.1 hypothetical protein Cal7507_1337 [Calothrix sp. PCC 7507]
MSNSRVPQGGKSDSVVVLNQDSSCLYGHCNPINIIPGNQEESRSKVNKTWKDYRPVKSYVVTPSVRNYLENELLSGFNKDSRRFVYHLIARSVDMVLRLLNGYINNYSKWIEKNFSKAEIGILELAEIIEIDHSYSVELHKSKQYRIKPSILYKIDELIFQDLINLNHERYDLMKGKSIKDALVSILYDENNNCLPEIVVQRIKGYAPCEFNWKGCVDWVIKLRNEANLIKQQHGSNTSKFQSAYARYRNDLDKLRKIITDCGAIHLHGDTWVYMAPYKAQKSGRLTHIGGGFQSASRGFTAAAFKDNPNYNNYDMTSAQPNCMAQLLESLGLDASFIKNEILYSKNKEALFERCGIKKQTGKDYLIALLIGSPIVPATIESRERFAAVSRLMDEWKNAQETNNFHKLITTLEGETKEVKIKKIKPPATISLLLKEFNNNDKLAFEALQKISYEFAPLIKVIEEYRQLLTKLIKPKTDDDKGLTKPDWLTKHKGITYIKNKCGMLLKVDDLHASQLIGKVTAHLLQGMEAAYMSFIIQLGDKYSYKAVQDFHDGAIIKGAVPIEAELEASSLSGVEGKLEIKPFEDPFNKYNPAIFDNFIKSFNIHANSDEELDTDSAALLTFTETTAFHLDEIISSTIEYKPVINSDKRATTGVTDINKVENIKINKAQLSIMELKRDDAELNFDSDEQLDAWMVELRKIEDEEEQKKQFNKFKKYAIKMALAS